MQRSLKDYIRRPDIIDDEAISQLQILTQEHPYFHVARILLLQALYRKHAHTYDETLRRTAVLVPRREALFRLTEEPHYTHAKEHKRYNEASDSGTSGSRTVNLIDNFLEAQLPDASVGHPIDAAQDYIGYLLQRESQQGFQKQDDLPMNGGGVVENFLENEPGRIVFENSGDNGPEGNRTIDSANLPKGEENEILTEIMAGIYIKQGKYENAVKIIRQLSLKYPKKNRYFADQIRFLEKLIINNKHK